MLDIPILPIAIGAAVILLIIFLLLSYVKAPPDHAYLISGLKKQPKVLVGRAGIRIPFLERLDRLYLGQMSVDIKTDRPVPTNDFINVSVDAVAKIRISPTDEGIALAAKNFLNKSADQIAMDLMDSLQGNMREIVGTLSLKDINTDRDSFSDQVLNKASKDLAKLGIEIVSCNIQNVTDENGLIKDLGADNTAKIKKDASIAKAQADRDVAIAQAQADREANDARVLAETEIAQKNNELEVKKAELKVASDVKKAQADAAYKIEEQEQQRTIETATVNAQIAKTEREAELKQREVEVAKQTLDAEIRAKADAEKYRQEKEAEAELYIRQRDAEAKLFEEQRAAEAVRARAEAAKYAKEQEAAGIAAVGKAEAEAIQAKALAEAEGIDKKAEAMKKYGEAAVIEMIMQALPDIAKNVAEPLSKVDKITMYGEGNSAKLIQDIITGTTQVTEGVAQGMGIDLKAMIAGMIGGKIASDPTQTTVVVETPPVKEKPSRNDPKPKNSNS